MAGCLLLLGACHGPRLHLDNPDGHFVFVDGVATVRDSLPFSFYGTRRIDALPADDAEGLPDPRHRPLSERVEIRPPMSPWLFPADFAGELLVRLFTGTQDQVVTVTVAPAPAAETPAPEIPAAAVGPLHDRAFAARTTR